MLHEISYVLPDQEVLFQNISIYLNRGGKAGLIGNNGIGKSTLMKIMAGQVSPASGTVSTGTKPYYIPQALGQFDHLTVTEALGVSEPLNALHRILAGEVTEENLEALNDEWDLEEKCREALEHWGIRTVGLDREMSTLSGGEKARVFLAGIRIHQPDLVLMDEPTNHLDTLSRSRLYDFMKDSPATMLVISHDRTLLDYMHSILELTPWGITAYGGNYSFYKDQKKLLSESAEAGMRSKEKELKKAKEKERQATERQLKMDARGKKKQEKAGVARIMMNTLRNSAEKSTSRLKDVHEDKVAAISEELRELKTWVPDIDRMKFGFEDSVLHKGKVLFSAEALNWKYDGQVLWKESLDFQIESGDRIAVKGRNGSGKSTLMKIISGGLTPESGKVYRAEGRRVYVDQDYSLLDPDKTVYEQVQAFNTLAVPVHEVKMNLHRLLFPKEDWDKPCAALSGGERVRLMLCCITIGGTSPDMIILDEPTNNLDIPSLEILTAAVKAYKGTLLLISHDQAFADEVNVTREINLDNFI
ncbi:MAG: ABC-F family ATP-binding cassette domain-containing protein [Leadbetterella sp.]|nr:ABC-F family ATP-binding cassette domain-containing protein [Leadbetterella sp.]